MIVSIPILSPTPYVGGIVSKESSLMFNRPYALCYFICIYIPPAFIFPLKAGGLLYYYITILLYYYITIFLPCYLTISLSHYLALEVMCILNQSQHYVGLWLMAYGLSIMAYVYYQLIHPKPSAGG
jgi:hypothetical protein